MNNHVPTALRGVGREASLVNGGATGAVREPSAKVASGDDVRLKEAAVQFEAVFVRQMLSSLEKATSSPLGNQTTGGSIYGSMVVNTVADAIAHAGGLGLGSLLLKSLQPQGASETVVAPAQGSEPLPVHRLQLRASWNKGQSP